MAASERWTWDADEGGYSITPEGGDEILATVFNSQVAAKMAAAPELLNALRMCAAGLEYAAEDFAAIDKPRKAQACRTRADAAYAAIAKASGSPVPGKADE